jgi:hypothetical protein
VRLVTRRRKSTSRTAPDVRSRTSRRDEVPRIVSGCILSAATDSLTTGNPAPVGRTTNGTTTTAAPRTAARARTSLPRRPQDVVRGHQRVPACFRTCSRASPGPMATDPPAPPAAGPPLDCVRSAHAAPAKSSSSLPLNPAAAASTTTWSRCRPAPASHRRPPTCRCWSPSPS